jgi:hypothetical protein
MSTRHLIGTRSTQIHALMRDLVRAWIKTPLKPIIYGRFDGCPMVTS